MDSLEARGEDSEIGDAEIEKQEETANGEMEHSLNGDTEHGDDDDEEPSVHREEKEQEDGSVQENVNDHLDEEPEVVRHPTSSPSGRSASERSDRSTDGSRRRIETGLDRDSAKRSSRDRHREKKKSPHQDRSRSPSPSPRRKRERSVTPQRRSRSRSGSRHRDRDFRRNGEKRRRSRSPRRRSRSPHRPPRYGRNSERDNPPVSRCVGVFGLSTRTREKDLREEFSKYGPLDNVQLIHDHKSGRSRGFGFVYFTYMEDAKDAREAANGMMLDDRRIRVDFSLTQRNRSPVRSPPRSPPRHERFPDRRSRSPVRHRRSRSRSGHRDRDYY